MADARSGLAEPVTAPARVRLPSKPPKPLPGWLKKLKKPSGLTRGVLVVLGVVAVAVLLGYLNRSLGLADFVDVPSRLVRSLWLPLIFLLICANAWLGVALYRLVTNPADGSEFEDIDRAWAEARLGLNRAGIEIDSLPLFLVLGEPAGGTRSLFEASALPFSVFEVPRRADAPLRVSATKEAIFVSCPGASVLARLAATLNDRGPATPTSTPEVAGAAELPDAPITPDVTALLGPPGPVGLGQSGPSRVLLLSRSAEIDGLKARLRYVCRLIARDRSPFCPTNGILLLIPFGATDDDDQARQAGSVCHLDFATASEALRVQCPVQAIVCDLELVPRIDQLLQAFSKEQRLVAMGRTFPLSPDLDAEGRVNLVQRGAEWIGQSLVPAIVLRLFRLDAVRADAAPSTTENDRLVEFLAGSRIRWKRLGRILGRLVSLDTKGQLMFGACHVACTGDDPDRQQAFARGPLQLLIERQDLVSWDRSALDEDRADSWSAQWLNLLALALAAITVVAVCLLLRD
jgi:hypothetical protein